jgi:hypothetical protein
LEFRGDLDIDLESTDKMKPRFDLVSFLNDCEDMKYFNFFKFSCSLPLSTSISRGVLAVELQYRIKWHNFPRTVESSFFGLLAS